MSKSKNDKLKKKIKKNNNNKRNSYVLMRDIHVMMILVVNINNRKRYGFIN
jgi:hypothetical protein